MFLNSEVICIPLRWKVYWTISFLVFLTCFIGSFWSGDLGTSAMWAIANLIHGFFFLMWWEDVS